MSGAFPSNNDPWFLCLPLRFEFSALRLEDDFEVWGIEDKARRNEIPIKKFQLDRRVYKQFEYLHQENAIFVRCVPLGLTELSFVYTVATSLDGYAMELFFLLVFETNCLRER